jgi:hypothetical protein
MTSHSGISSYQLMHTKDRRATTRTAYFLFFGVPSGLALLLAARDPCLLQHVTVVVALAIPTAYAATFLHEGSQRFDTGLVVTLPCRVSVI